jgi:hypothetical protein
VYDIVYDYGQYFSVNAKHNINIIIMSVHYVQINHLRLY